MRKRETIFLAVLIIIILSVIALKLPGAGDYFTAENIKQDVALLRQNVEDHYVLAVLFYILIYIVIVGFSVPEAFVLSIAGGFLFGTILGTVYVNIGATTGAILAFLFSRHLVGHWFQRKYREKLEKFNDEIKANGANYLLMLRFIILIPSFLINILAGLSRIPLKTFVWTTSLGILPSSLLYAYTGSKLKRITSAKDIVLFDMLAVFLLFAFFAILPVILKKLKISKKR